MNNNEDHFEDVICPWCQEEIAIDTRESPFGFKCPKCEDEFSLAAARNPSSHPKVLDINRNASKAIAKNVHRHTVAFINNKNPKKPELATGVLIWIASRPFIMTAGHTIPEQPQQNLGFVSKLLEHSSDLISLNIVASNKSIERGLDIGFMEVRIDDELEKLGLDAVPLDRVQDLGIGDNERPVRIVGFPGEWAEPNHQSQTTYLTLMSLGAETIPESYWPALNYETRKPIPGCNIVLSFNRDNTYMSSNEDCETNDGPPEPYGMSGGGCWQSAKPMIDSAVWSAEELSLFGIQYSWPREGRFLKATQIIHWLKLVADSCPELKGELINRYPRIARLG